MSLEMFQRILAPIKRSISILVSKALLSAITDEDNKIQITQVDLGNDQTTSGVERVQNFGFTSHPEEGAQAIVLSLAGNRDHQVVIAADDNRYRVSVSKGNCAIYNKDGMVLELRGEEILLGTNRDNLVPLDGVITGKAIDTLTGVPLGSLPGNNALGTQNSLKLKVEL